jgi:hypothetical protein
MNISKSKIQIIDNLEMKNLQSRYSLNFIVCLFICNVTGENSKVNGANFKKKSILKVGVYSHDVILGKYNL